MSFKHSQNDSGRVFKAQTIIQGRFAEGCFKNCDELNDLIIFERMKYEQRKVKILKSLVDYMKKESFDYCLEVIMKSLKSNPMMRK